MRENSFSQERIAGVYDAIFKRRDVRHFKQGALPDGLLQRMFEVAHAAPSVGFMQPWRFIHIVDNQVKNSLHQLVERERIKTAEALDDRQSEFLELKVQGILDCAEVLVVTLMDDREHHVFGRRTLPEMDLASAACAIQNMWLAARAEGIGMGWVSLFEPVDVRQLLNMPETTQPIAILCLGEVEQFEPRPLLEQAGWAERGKLEHYVMTDQWQSDKASLAQQQWQNNKQ